MLTGRFFMPECEKDKIVAFSTSGNPLTREQYIDNIEKAISTADSGELISDDDLQKEVKTW